MTVDEEENDATITIISSKFTGGFSSNALILFKNGLHWIFNRDRAELASIANVPFRDKILEVRSIVSGLGPSNVTVRCYFTTNGLTSEISPEYEQERRALVAAYANDTFAEFTFESLGADELVSMLGREERRSRSIDADIPIKYDSNIPSLIRYDREGLKGVICTAAARDIAEIVNRDTCGALFDSNIRRFLGRGKSVNADILRTASDAASSYLFWFLNNGITIVCDRCDPVPDPPKIKIKNLQIVNGCQTANALAHAAREGTLCADTRLLLKVFETSDATLADRIVITTNTQNRISSRDLKSNDAVQQDMKRRFDRYNLLYEHKVNQYATIPLAAGQRVVSNEEVGQSYLAIALKKPGDARRRKYKVWTDNYADIFSGENAEPHVICVLLKQAAETWRRAARRADGISEYRRKLINNGILHIVRIAAFLWRGTDSFNQPHDELEAQIQSLQSGAISLDPIFNDALDRLDSLIAGNTEFFGDVDGALKSGLLESAISRSLHVA